MSKLSKENTVEKTVFANADRNEDKFKEDWKNLLNDGRVLFSGSDVHRRIIRNSDISL